MTNIRTQSLATMYAVLLLAACGDKDHSHVDGDHHAQTVEKAHEADHEMHEGETHEAEAHEKDELDDHNDHDNDDTRQLGSHVHGDAMLSLALDADVLVVELESPLYNLLGYEHAPETESQRKNLELVESMLSETKRLFALNGEAGCKAEPASDIHLFNDHDDHHNDDDHSDHKDTLLEYSFVCEAPEKLQILTVNLFDHFPEMGELETVYLGPSIQAQADLTANNRTMKLTK